MSALSQRQASPETRAVVLTRRQRSSCAWSRSCNLKETNTPDKHDELTAYKITRTAIARSFKTKLRIERARMTRRYSHQPTRNYRRWRGRDWTLSPLFPRPCAPSSNRRPLRCNKSRCLVSSCSRILLKIISRLNHNQHHRLVEQYFHFYSKLHKEKCRCSIQKSSNIRLRGWKVDQCLPTHYKRSS